MLLVQGLHFENHWSRMKGELGGPLLHEGRWGEGGPFFPFPCWVQNAHKLLDQENQDNCVLGRWSPTLLLTSPDLCVHGPGGLTLESLPGFGTRERALGGESEVGVPGFHLIAMNSVSWARRWQVCAPTALYLHVNLSHLVALKVQWGNLDSGYYRRTSLRHRSEHFTCIGSFKLLFCEVTTIVSP